MVHRNLTAIDRICQQLAPHSAPHCVSLEPYLSSGGIYVDIKNSAFNSASSALSTPCRSGAGSQAGGGPCADGQVCVVGDSSGSNSGGGGYSCVPGCRLGDMSQMYAPPSTWLQLPSEDCSAHPQRTSAGVIAPAPVPQPPVPGQTNSVGAGRKCAYQLCLCNVNGELRQCQKIAPRQPEPCRVNNLLFGKLIRKWDKLINN